MPELGFKIVRTPYPSSSKMKGTVVQKVRDDGRSGAVVGDEALLWDALQEALAASGLLWDERCKLQEEVERLVRENDELRRQLEQRKGKR